MTGVVLFGGTTEGRQLAQALDGLCAARGLTLTVFVATEYGQEVLPALTHGQVHTGRLAPEVMTDRLAGCQLIIDATHPYAETVSASSLYFVILMPIDSAAIRLSRMERIARPSLD